MKKRDISTILIFLLIGAVGVYANIYPFDESYPIAQPTPQLFSGNYSNYTNYSIYSNQSQYCIDGSLMTNIPNPFNQTLNTTSDVQFNNISFTENLFTIDEQGYFLDADAWAFNTAFIPNVINNIIAGFFWGSDGNIWVNNSYAYENVTAGGSGEGFFIGNGSLLTDVGGDTNFTYGGTSNDTITIDASVPQAIKVDTNGKEITSVAQGIFDVQGKYATPSISAPLYFHPTVRGSGSSSNFLGLFLSPTYNGTLKTFATSYRPTWVTGTKREDTVIEYKPQSQDISGVNTTYKVYNELQIPSGLASTSSAVNNTYFYYRGFTMGQDYTTITYLPGDWNLDISSVLFQLKGGGALANYGSTGGSIISRGLNFTNWGDLDGIADIKAIEVHGGGIFDFGGADDFVLSPNVTTASGNSTITDSSSYWFCTASDCSSTCQVTIEDGLIVGCT